MFSPFWVTVWQRVSNNYKLVAQVDFLRLFRTHSSLVQPLTSYVLPYNHRLTHDTYVSSFPCALQSGTTTDSHEHLICPPVQPQTHTRHLCHVLSVRIAVWYNHSVFLDLILSGLFGFRSLGLLSFSINPLGVGLSYFAVDNLRYQGKNLAIRYDATGAKYVAPPPLVNHNSVSSTVFSLFRSLLLPCAYIALPPFVNILHDCKHCSLLADSLLLCCQQLRGRCEGLVHRVRPS
jgi:hypothetical protein